MMKTRYDSQHNAVIVEFSGDVTVAEAEQVFADLDNVLPKHGKGFMLLTDFSTVKTMEMGIKQEIEEAMELFDAMWVTEILRVLPDPAMDIGFNVLSISHYSKHPKVITCRTRQEADAYLRDQKTNIKK